MYLLVSFRNAHKILYLIFQSVILNNKLTILRGGDLLKLVDKYIM